MIMDALDALSQLALAQVDQLAILEAVQNCSSNQQSADQDLLCIPDEDILSTPGSLDNTVTLSEHMGSDFVFNHNNASMMQDNSCRQQKRSGK